MFVCLQYNSFLYSLTMVSKWILSQGRDGVESEVINLSEKIPFSPPKKQAALTVPAEQGKPLPGWSEKVAQGILSGGSESHRAGDPGLCPKSE